MESRVWFIILLLIFYLQQKLDAVRCLRSSKIVLKTEFDVESQEKILEQVKKFPTLDYEEGICFVEIVVNYNPNTVTISTDRNMVDEIRHLYMWYDTYIEPMENDRLQLSQRVEIQCNRSYCDKLYILHNLAWLFNYTYQEYNQGLTSMIKIQDSRPGFP